jgi:hypothetical protein
MGKTLSSHIFALLMNECSYVSSHVMNGKTYTGFLPVKTPNFDAPAPSIVRQVNANMPVYDVSSKSFTCGEKAVPIHDNGVSRVGEVTAGSKIGFYWGTGWPHAGSVVTYMARCNPDCGKFTGTEGNVWFKIQDEGYRNGSWATDILATTGAVHATVPSCLAPGEYLVRHEIVNVGNCLRVNGCQIYPSCVQVKVIGNGDVRPKELTAFPGTYTSKNILWQFNKIKKEDYKVPGPSLFECPKAT